MSESSTAEEKTGEEDRPTVPEGLVRLLKIPQELRKAEDVFEISNGLYRASFVRQLGITTRYSTVLVVGVLSTAVVLMLLQYYRTTAARY